jgi:inosine-uridine nucleoside N-ribohydrolase
MMTRLAVILDTDPGVDDALALVYALNCPALELLGVTTVHGNVSVDRSTRNALGLLELARPEADIPVARGAAEPLNGLARREADFVHGTEGLGDTAVLVPRRAPDPRPAWQFMRDQVAARPGEITLCAIGPMTNLALALEHAPEIAGQVAGVVVMGGAVTVPGNITPQAEYNVWADPAAAAAVLAAPWPVTLVGLDVTTQVMCTLEDFAAIAQAAPRVGGFLAQAAEFYVNFYRRAAGIPGCHLHDPSALIALSHPALFAGQPMALTVGQEGEARGRTLPACPEAAGQPAVRVLTEVDAAAVKAQFMLTLGAADRRPVHS